MLNNTSPDKTIELLGKAVEARGEDFVYPDAWKTVTHAESLATLCMYVHNDQPGCIAGYVLHEYGVPIEDLKRFEGRSALGAELEFGLDHASVALLMTAQNAQDMGNTWGEAYDLAKQQLPEVR